MIGCCPGLYRVIKTAVSPSKHSYNYNTYSIHGRGDSGMPSTGARGGDIALHSFTGEQDDIYQSASAYRTSSTGSSQEKLAQVSDRDRGNIMVNYGVAVTIEDRSVLGRGDTTDGTHRCGSTFV